MTTTTYARARASGVIEIFVRKGQTVLLDADVFARLPRGCLYFVNGYPRIDHYQRGKKTVIHLHRFVLGLSPGDGKIVDHINERRSDDRRANLRVASHSLNSLNKRAAYATNATGLLGVSVDSRRIANRYRAGLTIDGKYRSLGAYPTPEEAHAAYLNAKQAYLPPQKDLTC